MQIAEQGLPTKAIGRWFPYVATLLLFVWIVNLLGFIPLPFSEETRTRGRQGADVRHLRGDVVDLGDARARAAHLRLHDVEGIRHNGPVRYFKSWIPDVPKPMLLLIVPLEVLGQFMRLISLSVRLFANMLAGHMTILIFLVLVLSALPVLIPFLLLGSILCTRSTWP